jgi:hypothetical protein
MLTIHDWNKNPIPCARSRGGVLVTAHPFDNLVRTGCQPWPPAEIVQKLYQSRQIRAFDPEQASICTSGLGYYCDLQSLNSEDAITWSFFGTVKRSAIPTRDRWLADFVDLLQIPDVATKRAELFLWRRVPHPDTLVPGGPEIDIGIVTNNAVILGEAKWRSATGTAQGKLKGKDQIQLRGEFLATYGPALFPYHSHFAVFGIGLTPEVFKETTPKGIQFRTTTWEHLCSLPSHPHAEELRRYYLWKESHSRPIRKTKVKGSPSLNDC